ncbi:hypothetical protein [Burkholderia multivorans]|uniref:hypothetical protein n=1 Tax=Burkholderia multivorans TaxID=87883 RepID=UPI000277ECCB|nr:hypothetical protein [Burkholderia multivorans]EJO52286.1 hypothetical protein BURMUCF2_1410 [Burkholderia multivorans CF2]MBJ9656771.1 hypothetical protein [Burkholderia multivorans]MBU9471089.1 hypothetical protein [Burkholderia multivorans]
MDFLSEVVAKAGGAAAIVIIVIGATWLIFKEAATSWLTKRIGNSLERNADYYKHELAREMEKFKDELARVQSAERFKSEARRAVAERILDRRISAYQDVMIALNEIPSWVMSQMCVSKVGRAPIMDFFSKMNQLSGALDRNSLYFDQTFVIEYRRVVVEIQKIGNEWGNSIVMDPHSDNMMQTTQRVAAIGYRVTEMFKTLPDDVVKVITGDN